MNVMNNNNIDNSIQAKRENTTKSIKMGEEKKLVIKLQTSNGDRACTGKPMLKEVSSQELDPKKAKRKRKSPLVPWKKPEGMPKRPLSAYNLFFQDRRKSIMLAASGSNENLVEEPKSLRKSGKKRSGVGFANLARTIGTEWRALQQEKKCPYNLLAANDKDRYDGEMKIWRAKEKEAKSLRESNPNANATFDCVTVMPSFSSMASRKGLGDDLLMIRNKSTDLTGIMGGVSSGDDLLQQLQDHESRGGFNSSMYGNYNNNSYLMDNSDHSSNSTLQQQQQAFGTDKRHLAQFNTSPAKDYLEQSSIARENFLFGTMNTVGTTQASQYQNQPFLSSGAINAMSKKVMPWSVPRNAVNMDNMVTGSIDLEPLPLPDNHQQHRQRLFTIENQMGWLQQLHAKEQQQQRINIASSNEQYLQRLSTAGASMFSSGWEQQNSSSWSDKNTNVANANANDPIVIPLGDGSVNQESSTAGNGSNSMAVVKNGGNEIPAFAASSTNASNQDPWNPIGFFNEAN